MAMDTAISSDTTADSDGVIVAGWRMCKAFLRETAFIVGGVAWVGFWLIVLQTHLQDGDWTGMIATGMFATLGMIVVLWRLARFVTPALLPRPIPTLTGQSTDGTGE
ncbi:MAG: hypothetical protein ABEH65_05575 [Halobacteriales archaeon]